MCTHLKYKCEIEGHYVKLVEFINYPAQELSGRKSGTRWGSILVRFCETDDAEENYKS